MPVGPLYRPCAAFDELGPTFFDAVAPRALQLDVELGGLLIREASGVRDAHVGAFTKYREAAKVSAANVGQSRCAAGSDSDCPG